VFWSGVKSRKQRITERSTQRRHSLSARFSLAATIFQIFVAADNASDTLNQLKRIHGMMPYFMLKGILKVSNPMAMIRGILDLFLARPFGGQSLLQRYVIVLL
jgi:hypothetical protein